MDVVTLRVAFGVVAICVLALFYGATYRTTRSAFCGWWCASMATFIAGALLFLLNGTALQVVANPAGNTLAVAGGACVWAAAGSLRGATPPRWQLAIPPGVVLVASALDDPARDIWAGGEFFLAGMGVTFGLSSWELVRVLHARDTSQADWAQHRFTVTALLVASALVAMFYLARCTVFAAVGPDHALFRYGFGSEATTLLTMAVLVVVTFSMSTLSHLQQTSELRVQATYDGLTGVLNRSAFLEHAQLVFDDHHAADPGVVMVADIDDFKALNDGFGHTVGDRALTTFATVCQDVVGDRGVVGRLGGDEFALVIPDGIGAEDVAATISCGLRERTDSPANPTVSFGIATIDPTVGVKDTIIRADIALYQAKAAGRDRAMRYHAANQG
jgi:diguanylate cyclase (GGDEF)-like protein